MVLSSPWGHAMMSALKQSYCLLPSACSSVRATQVPLYVHSIVRLYSASSLLAVRPPQCCAAFLPLLFCDYPALLLANAA